MRKVIAVGLLLIAIHSCRKENVEASTALESHAWNPYQARIITVDTTTIITFDNTGKKHSVSRVVRKDTTYNFDPCAQQSTYSFLSNGTSHITDMCSTGQPVTDTPWAIQRNRILQIVFLEDPAAESYFARLYPGIWPVNYLPGGMYPVQNGVLAQINGSGFVVDQRIGLNGGFSYYVNGNQIDSVVSLVSDRYVSFRSQ